MAYVVMASIVIAYVVMVSIVMAYIVMFLDSYGYVQVLPKQGSDAGKIWRAQVRRNFPEGCTQAHAALRCVATHGTASACVDPRCATRRSAQSTALSRHGLAGRERFFLNTSACADGEGREPVSACRYRKTRPTELLLTPPSHSSPALGVQRQQAPKS